MVDVLPGVGAFCLNGQEGHHAAVVRRMRIGESLMLTDGAGRTARAFVTAVHRGTLDLDVTAVAFSQQSALTVTLVQALPKGERSELAVEMATEAGADALVPWSAARCVARWSPEKAVKGRDRWCKVAAEAAKQARRSRIPVVSALASTAEVIARIGIAAAALVLHEAGSVSITAAQLPSSGELLLIVGPEGGVSPEELAAFRAAGAQVVRLGPEVLRTSTAAAVALGALGVLSQRWAEREDSW